MSSRIAFNALAASAGVEVDYQAGRSVMGDKTAAEIMLHAPVGKIFVASHCHVDGSLCHDVERDGTATFWARSYRRLALILADGVVDCPDGDDCDICNPEP